MIAFEHVVPRVVITTSDDHNERNLTNAANAVVTISSVWEKSVPNGSIIQIGPK